MRPRANWRHENVFLLRFGPIWFGMVRVGPDRREEPQMAPNEHGGVEPENTRNTRNFRD